MSGDFQVVPIWRLTDRMVRSTLVTAWRLATSPTSTSPLRANATIDGVVRAPSALAMTVGSPPSRTLTTELVVPRSMPTARAIVFLQVTGAPAGAPGESPGRAQPKLSGPDSILTHHRRASSPGLSLSQSSQSGGRQSSLVR